MLAMTTIARLSDGLQLAASLQTEDQGGGHGDLSRYQSQAKQLFRKLSTTPLDRMEPRMSIELVGESGASSNVVFHYMVETGVCYLTLCDRTFPTRLAFQYLDEVAKEFTNQVSYDRMQAVTRPFHFIEFDRYMNKSRKAILAQISMTGTTGRSPPGNQTLDPMARDLKDIKRVMVDNISQIMDRGNMLEQINTKAIHLHSASKQFATDSGRLNSQAFYAKVAIIGFVFLVIFLYVYFAWL